MGNAILTGQSGSSPPTIVQNYGYTLLAESTVTGSAVTTVTFSGLNVGVGDELLLVGDLIGSGNGAIRLYTNSNTTNTNYYRQRLTASSTTVSAVRINDPSVCGVATSARTFFSTGIKLTNNSYITYQTCTSESYSGSGIVLENMYGTSTFTATSITRLDITASVASAIGIGSRFWLYKINGKEAKTWVTS